MLILILGINERQFEDLKKVLRKNCSHLFCQDHSANRNSADDVVIDNVTLTLS